MTAQSSTVDLAAAYAEFRAQRQAYATGHRSPVHFYWGNHVETPGFRVLGAPGRWSPLEDGRAGLKVTATAADGIRIGGELVDGEAELFLHEEDGPVLAEFPDDVEGVIFSYDGRRFALQVWNDHSEWARRFHGISAYDYDPSWRVEATVSPVAEGRTVAISHYRHPEPVDVPVVAELRFTRDGQEHALLASRSGSDGLFFQFRDTTNGEESYGAGRGMRLTPDGDRAILDFNYATLLPCSFSEAWNCPLPPKENTLPIPVRAGEKNAVDATGEPML